MNNIKEYLNYLVIHKDDYNLYLAHYYEEYDNYIIHNKHYNEIEFNKLSLFYIMQYCYKVDINKEYKINKYKYIILMSLNEELSDIYLEPFNNLEDLDMIKKKIIEKKFNILNVLDFNKNKFTNKFNKNLLEFLI